jgi:hypothetical protein
LQKIEILRLIIALLVDNLPAAKEATASGSHAAGFPFYSEIDMDWLSFFAGACCAITATAFFFCVCCLLSARTLNAGIVELERERKQSLDVRA